MKIRSRKKRKFSPDHSRRYLCLFFSDPNASMKGRSSGEKDEHRKYENVSVRYIIKLQFSHRARVS